MNDPIIDQLRVRLDRMQREIETINPLSLDEDRMRAFRDQINKFARHLTDDRLRFPGSEFSDGDALRCHALLVDAERCFASVKNHWSDLNLTSIEAKKTKPRQLPPLNAEFLFYLFLDKHNNDAIVGDLEERYRLIHKKFGQRRADFWYWTQAIRSFGPIMLAWTKRLAVKPALALITWALAKGLLRDGSWLATIVEMYRRIRS